MARKIETEQTEFETGIGLPSLTPGSLLAVGQGGQVIGAPEQATSIASLEVGRTPWGPDYAMLNSVPTGGMLATGWFRVPEINGAYPRSRGNFNTFLFRSDNWFLTALTLNYLIPSEQQAMWNANTMIFANPGEVWLQDYTYYNTAEADAFHEVLVRGWTFGAWYARVDADSLYLGQWVKLGTEGELVFRESTVLFTTLRALLVAGGWTEEQAAAWSPHDFTTLQVGDTYPGYITRVRVYGMTEAPTPQQVDAISRSLAPDPNAWGDYLFNFQAGAVNLQNRNGDLRHLVPSNGATRLRQGPVWP